MKKKLVVCIIISLFLISYIPSGYALINNQSIDQMERGQYKLVDKNTFSKQNLEHGLMRPDGNTLKEWKEDYFKAEKAYINPKLANNIIATSSYSILDLLNYVPSERNQGWCGNCWAWPATSVVEIALNVQEGIYERLSVQYINSCGSQVGVGCCDGGNLDIFCRFYRKTDITIPWSNTNADWQDNRAQCDTSCDSISTTPYYPISSIYARTIETHEISEEQAISNIKNILHQQKGVYFSFILPDDEYLTHFNDFWSDQKEEDVYNIDWACGKEYIEDEGAGHAVLCVGYNDEEGIENDYWIMLNSWGITSDRSTGLFRMNMHMDYDCTIVYQNHDYYSFDFETLNVTFTSDDGAPNPPEIQGPSSVKKDESNTYQITTIDVQNDEVFYKIDWDDGTVDGWIGPYLSGETIEVNHSWAKKDTYVIHVKAKDINEDESLWSTFEVSLSKRKDMDFTWIQWLFQRINILFPFIVK
ncbi:MAG: hypothetical protein DRN27_01565 [Thermoplasmata archaeon]|nr:MAG: hypothetical protein DRN27_01565 [Thermoplasmata archaeon]